LQVYNSLLKKRIIELERQLGEVVFHSRYAMISMHIQYNQENPVRAVQSYLEHLAHSIETYRGRLQDLSNNDPIWVLKEVMAGPKEAMAGLSKEELESLEELCAMDIEELLREIHAASRTRRT
jgi:hypothetical protein